MTSTTSVNALRNVHVEARNRMRNSGLPATSAVAARPSAALPRRWLDIVLPAELPALAREIIRQVRDEIPEYRHAMDGSRGRSIREGTEAALIGFTAQFLRTGALTPDIERVFRELGRREAQAGRGPDVVQAAFRVGVLVAWRRILTLCEREPLPAECVGGLAESIFGFADLLARIASDGYAAAHGSDALVLARLRARLARMISNQPEVSIDAIRDLAARLEWSMPERVVMLDVAFDESEQDPYPAVLAGLGADALAEIEPGSRLVVLPAPADLSAVAGVVAAVPGARISVGLPLPFADAAQSLRWARLATRLRAEGLLPDEPVTLCEAHLPTLLVHAEPGVAAVLAERRLGPLLALPEGRRLKFARLLSAWLEHRGSQAELAEALGTHRQTLHYRIGRLQAMFGEQLNEPDARLEIVLALRAMRPRWETEGR